MAMATNYGVHKSWVPLFDKWQVQIDSILADVYSSKSNIKTFPPKEMVFKAFEIDVEDISVVIVGQDCYHGVGQAMGLCFSVPQDVKIPPSLVNIFKEINNEFPERNYSFKHGDLTEWMVKENMFLINSALTVKQSTPLSHIKKWEKFTDDVIQFIIKHNANCVFLLLGNYAKDKAKLLGVENEERYIKGVHPSPLSAHNGFFDSSIFKTIETKLGKMINWQN
jgi:uracil-DNA glycosylase